VRLLVKKKSYARREDNARTQRVIWGECCGGGGGGDGGGVGWNWKCYTESVEAGEKCSKQLEQVVSAYIGYGGPNWNSRSGKMIFPLTF